MTTDSGPRKGVHNLPEKQKRDLHPAGLLQPLDIPSMFWSDDIAMDFVEGFLHINGKSVVLTVVDCLSKVEHLIQLGHPYTSTTVARAFFDNVVWLHRI
jgi:hypothetical protein